MAPSASPEGGLTIRLRTAAGCVERVSIKSARPLHASRVFEGKHIEEALHLLPLLFSVCGVAQAFAGVQACEQALGVKPTPHLQSVRRALLRMETLREQLWRILLDWPGILNLEPRQTAMAALLRHQQDHRHALTGGQNPFLPEVAIHGQQSSSVAQELSCLLGESVFGMAAADWLDISFPQTLAKWAERGETAAAQVVNRVTRSGWSGLGRCGVAVLPPLDSTQLREALRQKGFVEQPMWCGQCCETTSLTRTDSPLLRLLRARYDNGLLVRVVARLTEIAQLSQRLMPEVIDDSSEYPVTARNSGIGRVAAARGELVHCVHLQGEQIERYRILAPTEWNFHPQGVAAQSLATLEGDCSKMREQAALLIDAIDPCVGYELSIEGASHRASRRGSELLKDP